MPVRLSSPITDLKSDYQVVVVGSGYGGAIAASRLARAGKDVCVLERGREIQPGEYPDTLPEAKREFQVDDPAGRVGDPAGLYDLRINEDICVFVGCGLGGTSLVNANVSLPADPRVFEDVRWPKALRADVAGRLQSGYDEAVRMLKPERVPANIGLRKLSALQQSAEAMGAGERFTRVPINVTFAEPQPGVNHVGVEQHACSLCGDCVTGCNHSAKNTVLMNYLPDARNYGATIFTNVSVRKVTRENGKWVVHCKLVGEGREKFGAPEAFVRADMVVLAAGTLGSTEILLRSREAGLPVSDHLGLHFTGNGDVLGFSYNGDTPICGVGFGNRDPKKQEDKVGPCITGAIDLRNRVPLEAGMIIEDGSLPGALAPGLPAAYSAASVISGTDTDHDVVRELERSSRELESLAGGAYVGALRNTQTYLVMAHDDGAGRMVLDDDRVRIRWPSVSQQPVFAGIKTALEAASRPAHGVFVQDPISSRLAGQDLITVHPLGGCIMADDASQGVVNDRGQVFAGTGGAAVHERLYVSDGSVIPRPLGVNPLLTISALAERTWMLLAEAEGRVPNFALPSKPKVAQPARKVGIRFTERMAGFYSDRVDADYPAAAEAGKADGTPLEFTVTIASDDLDTFLNSPDQAASVVGTVTAPGLDARPLLVSGGTFNLLPRDPQAVETRRMRYRMQLTAEDGRTWYLDGHKIVHADPRTNPWIDTTTLFFTLQKPDAQGRIVGKGILRLGVVDFAKQMTTVEATNANSLAERLEAVWRFGKEFAGSLYDVYGGVTKPLSAIRPEEKTPRKKRPLRAPTPEVHTFETGDGKQLRLARYKGGDKGPVVLGHGLGVSGLIFALDTVETNLVEYLCAHGYDVWNLEHRVSIDLPVSRELSTMDETARFDYPAAVAKVRSVTGRNTVQAIVHCYGATTFMMAQLAGLQGVRSAVVSQIATHIEPPLVTRIKTGLHLPEVLEVVGVKSMTADGGPNPSWERELIDQVLRFQPMGIEACQSPTCHRISFLYGLLYDHKNFNELTHATLHETFGLANIRAFEHEALLARKRMAVDFQGNDVYMDHPERLKLPIAFIHGGDNRCFLPVSTQKTFEWLTAANGDLYTRHVIPGYGHIDCIMGKDAVRDVYPLILRHLEATQDDDEVARRVAAAKRPPQARPSADRFSLASASKFVFTLPQRGLKWLLEASPWKPASTARPDDKTPMQR